MNFYPIAIAAKFALTHPKFKQPKLYKAGEWYQWIERDKDGRAIRIKVTQLTPELAAWLNYF